MPIRLVSGRLREIWFEGLQAGGAPQNITTDIRIAEEQLSRIQGILTIDAFTGAPAVGAVPAVNAGGFLVVSITNPVAGSTIRWTLDIQLTHSMQQATDIAAPGVILVVNGTLTTGLLTTETLHQAYGVGLATLDQTMVIDSNKGGGVIVDASTAAVTGGLYGLEVRQNASGFSTPMAISRRGNDTLGPILEFNKARGAFPPGAAADDQVNDIFGNITFIGRVNNLSSICGAIQAVCTAVAAGGLSSALAFYTTFTNVPALSWKMYRANTGPVDTGAVLRGFGTEPLILPDVDSSGRIGSAALSARWGAVDAFGVYGWAFVSLGGAAIVSGADKVVLFPNTSVMPAPQVDQVYLGSKNFGASVGTNLAVLEISAGEPVASAGEITANTLIPIRYNGVPYYLFAKSYGPPT